MNRSDGDMHRAGRGIDRKNPDAGRHSRDGNLDSRVGRRERNRHELRRVLKKCTGHTGELVLD